MTWYIEFERQSFDYRDYVHFLHRLHQGHAAGHTHFRISFERVSFFFPDGMAPFVATVRSLVSRGRRVEVEPPSSSDLLGYWESVGWLSGITGDPLPSRLARSSYVPLTAYENAEELNELIGESLHVLSEGQLFPTGVLQAFEWSINEIADNVLVHASSAEPGWMQLTSYPTKGLVEFVVVDTGRGVKASLSEAYPYLRTDEEALIKAVEKGTTRNRELGQGNGLSGTLRITSSANGWANLHSGTGQLRLLEGDFHRQTVAAHSGLVVAVTLPTRRPIDLSEALWGHVPVPAFEMEYLGEHGIEFVVGSEASNFGNRATGERLRTKLKNIILQFPDTAVVVDFNGVDLISASFADEFIAKLVREFGYMQFFGTFKFRNVCGFVAQTLDRVIEQRMSVPRTP